MTCAIENAPAHSMDAGAAQNRRRNGSAAETSPDLGISARSRAVY
jgi:hypothetical protein